MNKIKFINREEELRYVRESAELSKKKLFCLSISGLRRIGKTRLILEIIKNSDLYFFVNKNKNSLSLLKEYEENLKVKKILGELEYLSNWDQFFGVIFKRFNGILVFDEFQNFFHVDKTIFGILQKYIDLNENKKNLLIIFCGSLVGLNKKLFQDSKEPLYGRVKRKLNMKELSFKNIIKMCNELKIKNMEEVIEIYTIFGGFPKYYVSIEDENLIGSNVWKILERFFFSENAILEEEVGDILSLEFGKRSGIYYDILTAIANGNTKISKIASCLRKKESSLTRQIRDLVNYFELVGIEKQIYGKKSLFYIRHPLMNFWFRFIYKNLSSYKRRENWLIDKIKNDFNSYVGSGFERVCRGFIEENKLFQFTKIGKQWGTIPGKKQGENQYEIDIVALNEQKREILFGECKWKDRVNPEKVLQELKEKAGYVDWNKGKRKEYYAIFAKSFSKKINENRVLLFDLKDMEKVFRKR
ncbi:MAG: DUF234 domain-containing protein [Candidatus Aenigmatarchaeota archaeon]